MDDSRISQAATIYLVNWREYVPGMSLTRWRDQAMTDMEDAEVGKSTEQTRVVTYQPASIVLHLRQQ